MKQAQISNLVLNRENISKVILDETKRHLAHDKYFWLLSEYQSNTWKVIDEVKHPHGSNPEITYCDIDFTYPVLQDGTNLTDIENEQWSQLVRACLCFYRAGIGKYSTTRGKMVNRLKNTLVYLIDFFKSKGVYNLSHATPSLVEEFVFQYIPYGRTYFLNYRERISILLKQYRYKLPQQNGRSTIDTAALLAEANIPSSFAKDDFVKEIINHCESLQHRTVDGAQNEVIPVALLHPYETLTEPGIRRYIYALEMMFDVASFVNGTSIEVLQFDPIRNINISDLSNKDENRTRTIPPNLALKLIAQSITYIERYSDGLVSTYQYLMKDPDIRNGDLTNINSVFEKYRKRMKNSLTIPDGIISAISSSNTLHNAIFTNLVSACAVILFAFSARRESEVYDLRTNCRDYQDLLKIYIAKTDKAYDLIPKVQIVDKALDVLTNLSKHNRVTYGSSKIFEFTSLVSLQPIKWSGSAQTKINVFAEHVNCHIDEQGNDWRYSEHQFRRFFSMMYYWHSDAKNIEALSYHLRHFSLQMTQKYITEYIAGDIMRKVAKLKTKSLLEKSNGNNSPIGRDFQRRLASYKKHVLTKMNILDISQASKKLKREYNNNLDNIIDTCIENSNLIPEIKPWGICFGSAKGRQVRAKCVPANDKRKRDVFSSRAANASCEDCMGCSNLYADSDNIPFINLQIEEDTQILEQLKKQKNTNPSIITWLSNRLELITKQKNRLSNNNE